MQSKPILAMNLDVRDEYLEGNTMWQILPNGCHWEVLREKKKIELEGTVKQSCKGVAISFSEAVGTMV